MAKKESKETRTKIDDINDSLTRAELRIQKNKKLIMWICIGVAVLVVGVLIYLYAVLFPSRDKANTAYGKAANLENGFNMALESQQLDSAGVVKNINEIAAEYEKAARLGHDGGNNATLMAAVYNYRKGDYNKALQLLKDYDQEDEIIAATSKSLEGDCYVNLDKFDDAIKAYDEAIKIAEDNNMLIPYFMNKKAVVYHHLKNYSAEIDIYTTILDQYPHFAGIEPIEIYLELAKSAKPAK